MQIIRTLWGEGILNNKVLGDIEFLQTRPPIEFTCLTYGIKNHKYLKNIGINSILIHKEPDMFPIEKIWAHKIYAWKYAANNLNFDDFFYMDWDVNLRRRYRKRLLNRFLTCDHTKRKTLLISLRRYVNAKCKWRTTNKHILPCASWIYFGNKNIPNEIYDLWQQMGEIRKEERVLAKYTDQNNELDLEYYWENYEPQGKFNYFHLDRNCPCRKLKGHEKPLRKSLFKHYAHHKFSRSRKTKN